TESFTLEDSNKIYYLDNYVISECRDRNRMFMNNWNGTFTDVTDALGVRGSMLPGAGMVPSDFDNDRDIDLLLLHPDSALQILSNERKDRLNDVSNLAGIAGDRYILTLSVAYMKLDRA